MTAMASPMMVWTATRPGTPIRMVTASVSRRRCRRVRNLPVTSRRPAIATTPSRRSGRAPPRLATASTMTATGPSTTRNRPATRRLPMQERSPTASPWTEGPGRAGPPSPRSQEPGAGPQGQQALPPSGSRRCSSEPCSAARGDLTPGGDRGSRRASTRARSTGSSGRSASRP